MSTAGPAELRATGGGLTPTVPEERPPPAPWGWDDQHGLPDPLFTRLGTLPNSAISRGSIPLLKILRRFLFVFIFRERGREG